MKEQSIITVPNEILSEVAKKATSFDIVLENQIKIMRKFLKSHDGAGLAANQIGLSNRVVVIEFEDPDKKEESIPFQAFINPEIVEASPELDCLEEGCLSVPQIELPVERSIKIKLRAQTYQGKKFKLTAKGILARILQHEIDHLNGIIFTERIKEKLYLKNPELKKIKIAFFGSGDFALPVLEGLILLGFNPLIITEKPKPAGRKQILKATPIAELAKKFNKEVRETGKEDLSSNALFKNSFDLLICADFGQIIPKNILKLPKIAAINIHPSLLPKYRGATPIQTAILNGEKETGVTLIKMSPIIDQGPILAQVKTNIFPTDNSLALKNRLATLSLKLLFEALPIIVKREIEIIKQNEKEATQTRKFKKEDGEIDWKKSPEELARQIRAFYPWPGSFAFLPDGKRLLIHQSHLAGEKLVLDMVQPEGKKPMKWLEFLRGYRGQKPKWFN